jgi:hypothetical protein
VAEAHPTERADVSLDVVRAELAAMLASLAQAAAVVRDQAERDADRIRRDADEYAEQRRVQADLLQQNLVASLTRPQPSDEGTIAVGEVPRCEGWTTCVADPPHALDPEDL